MKSYITYFDFLGFKNFILNNDSDYIRKRVNNILRDIELSLGQGDFKNAPYGIISDISKSKLNCLNISDTIILWTNDDSFESFNELLKVSFDFNWRVTRYHFPVRGSIVYDEIDLITHYQDTVSGGTYNVNSIFGKGLVNAHLKAENLDLAGCVIDESVIIQISQFDSFKELLDKYAELYNVPYKKQVSVDAEYMLRFFDCKTINEQTFENTKKNIHSAFENDNKGMNERVSILLKNTIDFLESFKE